MMAVFGSGIATFVLHALGVRVSFVGWLAEMDLTN